MPARFGLAVVIACICSGALVAQRPAARHPDLQGYWTNGTATPLQRPAALKDRAFLTPAEAAEFESGGMKRLLKEISPEDIATSGDLNEAYLETHEFKMVPGRRTSLVVDRPDGRLPPPLPQALVRATRQPKHNYDDPEGLSLDERCLPSVNDEPLPSSSAAPPMVPNPFSQNFYQIVQTPDAVMIYVEVAHDARIIRLGSHHPPPSQQLWLGDSIGRWEGDTLVVDTTNFTRKTRFLGSGERLHVVERLTRVDANTITYRATVEDPDTWAQPWTIEYPFRRHDQPVLEYACHEANYSLESSLRGHRAQEKR